MPRAKARSVPPKSQEAILDYLTTAGELWTFLSKRGGLKVSTYDRGLVDAILVRLGLPPLPLTKQGDSALISDVSGLLDETTITVERFVEAFFGAVKPFSELLSELYQFLARHGVTGTGQNVAIKFTFDGMGDEITFDLKHFRKFQEVWSLSFTTVEDLVWSTSALWQISSILRESLADADQRSRPRDLGARRWIDVNSYPGRSSAPRHWSPPPTPPEVGSREIDAQVARVHGVISQIAEACAPYGNYERLRTLFAPTGVAAPLSAWAAGDLALLESDFFSGYVMNHLWLWTERITDSAREPSASDATAARLAQLFDAQATTPVTRRVNTPSLVELLDLPMWKYRHSLYQAWILTVIEGAVEGYDFDVHSKDGVLEMRFAETRLASIATGAGPVDVVAELRSPLTHPTAGTSRKHNVQPDYVLRIRDPEPDGQVLAVVEVKQYAKPDARKFAAALQDYATAHQSSIVMLADYGPMSHGVTDLVALDVRSRTIALGNVQPGSDGVEQLQTNIRRVIPLKPAPDPVSKTMPVERIVVDISGSMKDLLRNSAIVQVLNELSTTYPDAIWLGVDERVRSEGKGRDALASLLQMPCTGATSLVAALQRIDLTTALLITDEDGVLQMDNSPRPLALELALEDGVQWKP
jgi:hypothetical protein